VSADPQARPLCTVHHHGCVPANVGTDSALDLLIAGELRLDSGGDGVHVVGHTMAGGDHVPLLSPPQDVQHQFTGAEAAGVVDDRVHRVQPFLGLRRIRISRDGDRIRAVEEVTLQFSRHERGSLLEDVAMGCPPQFGASARRPLRWPLHAGTVHSGMSSAPHAAAPRTTRRRTWGSVRSCRAGSSAAPRRCRGEPSGRLLATPCGSRSVRRRARLPGDPRLVAAAVAPGSFAGPTGPRSR
jgi:hypothetical protein